MKLAMQGKDMSASEVLAEKRADGQEAADSHPPVHEPSDAELDSHHETLSKAEKIKADKHMMKYLVPHMQKKISHSQSALKGHMNEDPAGPPTSMPGLKKAAKNRLAKIGSGE